MSSPYGQIREGMDVVDLAGDKIGTISRVEGEQTMAGVGEAGQGVGRDMEAKRAGKGASGHIEVRRPGHDLFIPFSAINEVRGDAVSIIVDREAVDAQGWDRAPRTA
jgi:hypothetical protein